MPLKMQSYVNVTKLPKYWKNDKSIHNLLCCYHFLVVTIASKWGPRVLSLVPGWPRWPGCQLPVVRGNNTNVKCVFLSKFMMTFYSPPSMIKRSNKEKSKWWKYVLQQSVRSSPALQLLGIKSNNVSIKISFMFC